MMRHWWLGAALILAACASSGGAPPPPGTAQAFFTGPDTIQVTASDYVPARAVTLTGPFGEVPAVSIDTIRDAGYAAAPSGGALSFGLGAGGGGSFGGIGLGFPLIGGGAPASPPTAITNALIRVPAEPPYAQVWGQSQIRIQFGDPPGVKYISIPAPPPPPPPG
jgi:hypothetical protein